jgi:CRISPR-associated protein Cst2
MNIMSKTVVGLMLIDAPHSVLNNAGTDAGDRTDNIVRVKQIRKGNKVYPYVSGQALRYWWRETLEDKFNWEMSPIHREKKIAFTSADPISYDDDDVFGYMRAGSKKEGGTFTRISPLKNSPLVSVVGQYPTQDFGVMARHEGDPVPYEHEFYSTILKGIFSIDLDSLGRFYTSEKVGFRNMSTQLEELAEEKGLSHDEGSWLMDNPTRIKRAQNVINALPYLYGGALSTSHLTDVSPKLVILVAIDGGNHIFMNIVREENNELIIDIDALREILEDYKDILLTKVYIGINKGFLKEKQEDIINFAKGFENVKVGSIKEMTDDFSEKISELI